MFRSSCYGLASKNLLKQLISSPQNPQEVALCSWAQRIDEGNALVPGRLLSAPLPNHIVLDTRSGGSLENVESEVDF